jgi:hypothetical protein
MLDWADLNNAGVVYQDVDFAEALERLLNCGLDLRGLEQIAWNRQDFSSKAIQLSLGPREFFGIPRYESDLSSARTNLACNFQPKAARPAGNESDFIAISETSHTANVERSTPNVQRRIQKCRSNRVCG